MDVTGSPQPWNVSVTIILISVVIVLFFPLALHFYLYKTAESSSLPKFLLIGPSGSGKTSFSSLCERGHVAETHTSQVVNSVQVSLPVSTTTGSTAYRSSNDPANDYRKELLLVDTPGHGKLRQSALESITAQSRLKGIVFMVDSSSLTAEGQGDVAGLKETAQYLYDVLLQLQNLARTTKKSREYAVLIAANKSDLFTALPAALVVDVLETELSTMRKSRAANLLAAGADAETDAAQSEGDVLGGEGSERFDFGQMEEYGVTIEVLSGYVTSSDGASVDSWWNWFAQNS